MKPYRAARRVANLEAEAAPPAHRVLAYTVDEEDDEGTRQAKRQAAAAERGRAVEDFDQEWVREVVSAKRQRADGTWDMASPIASILGAGPAPNTGTRS